MNKIRRLQLVPINLLTQARTLLVAGYALPPALVYCLSKARMEQLRNQAANASLAPWQQAVLQTLPTELHSTGNAAAALTWIGEGGALKAGTWMQISLVHFAAGLNDVHIGFPDEIVDDEVQQLMSSLQPLLALSGFDLHHSSQGNWYLWCKDVLDVQTKTFDTMISTRSYDVLPSGKDAAPLRRLLTETQMLLSQHPVNQQRERRGLSPLNAAWMSGAGSPITATTSTLQRIMSDQPYVQGLCDQLNVSCWPVPHGIEELLNVREDDLVLVIQVNDVAAFDQQWLQPLVRVVNQGYIGELCLHLDQLKLSLSGGRWQQLRRGMSSANSIPELLS